MSDPKKNIDQFFKDQLADRQFEFQEADWHAAEHLIQQQAIAKGPWYWKALLGTVIIAGTLATAWYFYPNTPASDPNMTGNMQKVKEAPDSQSTTIKHPQQQATLFESNPTGANSSNLTTSAAKKSASTQQQQPTAEHHLLPQKRYEATQTKESTISADPSNHPTQTKVAEPQKNPTAGRDMGIAAVLNATNTSHPIDATPKAAPKESQSTEPSSKSESNIYPDNKNNTPLQPTTQPASKGNTAEPIKDGAIVTQPKSNSISMDPSKGVLNQNAISNPPISQKIFFPAYLDTATTFAITTLPSNPMTDDYVPSQKYRSPWSVSLYGAVNHTYIDQSTQQQELQNYLHQKQLSERTTLQKSLGLEWNYRIHQNILLGTGLHWQQYGFDYAYSLTSENIDPTKGYWEYYNQTQTVIDYQIHPGSTFTMDSSQITIPDSTWIATPDTSYSTIVQSGKQQFHRIHIPILAGYQYQSDKFTIDILTGISFSKLISHTTTYPDDNWERMETTSATRQQTNWHYQLQVAYTYYPLPKWGFQISPALNYSLSSISAFPSGTQQKLTDLQLRLGIRHDF